MVESDLERLAKGKSKPKSEPKPLSKKDIKKAKIKAEKQLEVNNGTS